MNPTESTFLAAIFLAALFIFTTAIIICIRWRREWLAMTPEERERHKDEVDMEPW